MPPHGPACLALQENSATSQSQPLSPPEDTGSTARLRDSWDHSSLHSGSHRGGLLARLGSQRYVLQGLRNSQQEGVAAEPSPRGQRLKLPGLRRYERFDATSMDSANYQ